MRILLVANTLPPLDLSGAGEQVVQLAEGLERRGHRVAILGRGRGGARGPKLLFPVTVLVPALRRIRAERPEVIQVHESDGGLLVIVLRLLRGWLLPPVMLVALLQVSYGEEFRAVRIVRDRSSGEILARPVASELRFRWLRAPVQFLLGWISARWCDLTLAPSHTTAAELRRDYGAREVGIVPNVTGAELLGEDRTEGEIGALPERFLLFVGRLRIRKGVEILLHAVQRLRRHSVEVELVIVGDGERRAGLESLASSLGVDACTHFVGRQPRTTVAGLLQRGLCLVVPSIYEGMPLVVLEAMQSGKPVVAAAVSGIPEVVENERSGWLVAPEDVEALAAALQSAWCEPVEAERLGREAQRAVAERFRPEHAAEAWERAIGSKTVDAS